MESNEVCKDKPVPAAKSGKDDPKVRQLSKCNTNNKVILLPILEQVHQKTLYLENFSMSSSRCKALVESFQFFHSLINRVIFDNCGLDDEKFAMILKSLQTSKDFKKIAYRNSIFHWRSLRELEPFIDRKIPNNLEELRIEYCKIDPSTTTSLIESLYERRHLRRLSLVNVDFTDESFNCLCWFVLESYHLEQIDLSWNNLRPQNFYGLLQVLANNQKLKYINLSCNTLLGDDVRTDLYGSAIMERKGEIAERDQFDEEKDMTKVFDGKLSVSAQGAIENLYFSYTGLSEKQLWCFGRAMRRAKSIRSLHLSGNPGITDRLVKYLSQRTHSLSQQEVNNMDLSKLPSVLKKNKQKQPLANPQSSSISTLRSQEVLQIKQFQYRKRVEQGTRQIPDCEKRTLLFTRQIGHKGDIPGAGQWKMITHQGARQNECWVCDKWQYSLIFWNQSIGEAQIDQFSLEDRNYMIKKLEQIQIQDQCDIPQDKQNEGPYIYGEFTNWRPKRMFEIREFCDRINIDRPNIFKECQEKGRIPSYTRGVEDLDEEEREAYERATQKHYNSYMDTWREVIKQYIPYQRPTLVNGDHESLARPDGSNIYVYACFVKFGKQNYYVRANKEPEVAPADQAADTAPLQSWYMHSYVSKYRDEEIPHYEIVSKKLNDDGKAFDKDKSVFAQWTEDDKSILRECLEHDLGRWKCSGFVQNKLDYGALVGVVLDSFKLLKSTFLCVAARSQFPFIDQNDFMTFAKKANIFDENMSEAAAERLFIEVNTANPEIQNENQDRELLNRWKFFELLVRVATQKYRRQGMARTVAAALDMLVHENLRPIQSTSEWQDFRSEQLWTPDVHDIFNANSEDLRTLYARYTSPREPTISFINVIHLFIDDSDMQVEPKDVKYCCAMSKETLIEEDSAEAEEEYTHLKFVEFLEMIGRAADLKFRGSELENLPLCEKIECILNDLLMPFGLTVKSARPKTEEQADESDTDY